METKKIEMPKQQLPCARGFHAFLAIGFLALAVRCRCENIPIRMVTNNVEIHGIRVDDKTRIAVEVLPLHMGHELALASRWDDNKLQPDVRMADTMQRYGCKATFYVKGSGLPVENAKAMLASGHGMGSHSITHTLMSLLSYNRIFVETAESRILLESAIDYPVNSFAFPYASWFADEMRYDLHEDIAQILRRAGFVHVAAGNFVTENMRGISDCRILPSDGRQGVLEAFEQKVKAIADEDGREPNISFGIHAWAYDSPEKWSKLESELHVLAETGKYWRCTQTEYGGYRFKREFSRIREVEYTSNSVSFSVVCPSDIDANSDVPLSLRASGCDFSDCKIKINGNPVIPTTVKDKTVVFSTISPRPGDYLIDSVRCDDGPVVPTEFPGLEVDMRLHSPDVLSLALTNSGNALSDIRITYRFPLAIEPGVVLRDHKSLSSKSVLKDAVPFTWARTHRAFLEGTVPLLAQIDFMQQDRRCRIHAMLSVDKGCSDADSWPKDNVSYLGPFSRHDVEATDLVDKALKNPLARDGYAMPDGKEFEWRSFEKDDGFYDPEMLVSPVKSSVRNPLYIVRTVVDSPEAREVEIGRDRGCMVWLCSDGIPRAVGSGERVPLVKGDNLLVYLAGTCTFARIADPQTGHRIPGIVYRMPARKDGGRTVSITNAGPWMIPVRNWLLCGPFPNPGTRPVKKGFNTDFLNAYGGEKDVVPAEGMNVVREGKTNSWQSFSSAGAMVNLLNCPAVDMPGDGEDAVVYAFCRIYSPEDREVLLGVGSDDGYKLWVNHRLVRKERVFRAASLNQELIGTRLLKGLNTILLKVDQDAGGFKFGVNLVSADARPLNVDVK